MVKEGTGNQNLKANSELNSALGELDRMVGLTTVKKQIRDLIRSVQISQKKKDAGLGVGQKTYHLVLTGNPGTGKTEVARLIAKIYKGLGIVEKGQFIELDRSMLTGIYKGEEEIKTTHYCTEALGGVLFIDEAYTLNTKDSESNTGQVIIDTLLKFMEDHRKEFVVIAAGYTKEMEGFIESNPGLRSRFSNFIEFPDYNTDELTQIFRKFCQDSGYVLSKDGEKALHEYMVNVYSSRGDNFSNARTVRNIFEKTVTRQETRLFEEGVRDKSKLREIIGQDFPIESTTNEDYMAQLDAMIGLTSVKTQVRELLDFISVNKLREKEGIKAKSISKHMVFSGNPGTGKTEVARLVAKIYHQRGIIPSDKFIEADRSTLVGQWVGETAIKTMEVCKKALGGVLFIDEAYSLVDKHPGGAEFGMEAIDTLLKFMEDNRDRIVVIVAGYSEEMKTFIRSNPGLESRFTNNILFPDYNEEELFQIFMKYCSDNDFIATGECQEKVKQRISEIYEARTDTFANARTIRNLFEQIIKNQGRRIVRTGKSGADDLITLTEEDV